jgi:hypothetical protein
MAPFSILNAKLQTKKSIPTTNQKPNPAPKLFSFYFSIQFHAYNLFNASALKPSEKNALKKFKLINNSIFVLDIRKAGVFISTF